MLCRLHEAYLLRRVTAESTGSPGELAPGASMLDLNGVCTAKDIKLSDLGKKRPHAPFHIINAAVDIQDKLPGDGTLMDRTVDFMTLSKLYIGSRRLGYTPTTHMEEAQPDLDLATATAISGAAIGQALASCFYLDSKASLGALPPVCVRVCLGCGPTTAA